MKEEKDMYGDYHIGYRIYPSLDRDDPIKLDGYVGVLLDTEFLNPEARQKIQINILHPHGIGKMMSLEQTRLF